MKSIDLAIRKAAIELDIPEDKAKVVVMEYWDTLFSKLLSGQHSTLTARHIGTFVMSRYKLNNLICKSISSIRNVRNSKTLSDKKKKETLDKYYRRLRTALKHRNELAISYAKIFGNV